MKKGESFEVVLDVSESAASERDCRVYWIFVRCCEAFTLAGSPEPVESSSARRQGPSESKGIYLKSRSDLQNRVINYMRASVVGNVTDRRDQKGHKWERRGHGREQEVDSNMFCGEGLIATISVSRATLYTTDSLEVLYPRLQSSLL